MVAEANGGISTDEPEFSGNCGSVSEVSKTAFLEPAFLEPVFSKPVFSKPMFSKQLKKNRNL
jgi:hypothetical protein